VPAANGIHWSRTRKRRAPRRGAPFSWRGRGALKPDEPLCGWFATALDAHCRILGHGAPFCELERRFWQDPTMGCEEVATALAELATPEQAMAAHQVVEAWAARGAPRPAGPGAGDPGADGAAGGPGQAAAERWLQHFRYGR
jgi:hypothetical protein